MNIILIVSDTLRRDYLGCYGNEWISTPHIDAFAAKAEVFDRHYLASFPTIPHRADVMTGRFTATYTPWAPLDRGVPVLAQSLTQAGYTTMMVTDTLHMFNLGFHFDRGFSGFEWIRGQEWDPYRTDPRDPDVPDTVAERRLWILRQSHRNMAAWRYEEDWPVAQTMTTACRWLEDNYDQGPFFLYVDTFDPHEPWITPQWYVDMYDPDYDGEPMIYPVYGPAELLSERELKNVRAQYAAEVTLVDRWVGRLLQKVEDMGLMEDTTVIFASDHGYLHGEHDIVGKLLSVGYFTYIPLYEEIAHIPLIIHMPGGKPGRRQAIVQPPDMMPTILELAGVDTPDTVQGKSFAHLLKGSEDRLRRFAASFPALMEDGCTSTVSNGSWVAFLKPKGDTPPRDVATGQRFSAEPSEPRERAVTEMQKAFAEAGDQLFRIDDDPQQQHDLADEHPEVLAGLRSDFIGLLEETGTAPELIEPWR